MMHTRGARNLAAADALVVAACLAGADWLGAVRQSDHFSPLTSHWSARAGVIIVAWLVLLYVIGAYDPRYLRMPGRSLYLTGLATILAAATCAAIFYLLPAWRMNRFAFIVLAAMGGLLLSVNRVLWLRRHQYDAPGEVFAIGDSELLCTAWREMNVRSEAPGCLSLVQCEDCTVRAGRTPLTRLPGLRVRSASDARAALDAAGERHTFITDGILATREAAELLTEAAIRGALVVDVFSFYELSAQKCPIFKVDGRWVFNARTQVPSPASLMCKRLVDLALSIIAAPIAVPLVLMSAAAIALESGFPVLYRQQRLGHRGRRFVLLKLRTMPKDAEVASGAVWSRSNDPRATRIGRFLRRTGIDELPQLVNVVLGQMSLVGPRPERPEIVAGLREEIPLYMQRYTVPPGITGWAQIHQGGDTCIEDVVEKLRYDLYYAKNFSLSFDMRILLRTLQMVLARAKPPATERPRAAERALGERLEGVRS